MFSSLHQLLHFAPYLPDAASLRSHCQQHQSAPSLLLMSSMYFLATYTAPSELSADVKSKLRQIARITDTLKTKIMMEAPYHSHSIMALDLLNTYDSLSEVTVLSQRERDDHQGVTENTRKRKRIHGDLAHVHARYRKTKGEAMMSRTLCLHLRSLHSITQSNDLEKENNMKVLCQSVELNAMTLLEDYDMVKREPILMTNADFAVSGEAHRALGRVMLQLRFDLEASVQSTKSALRFSRQSHLHGVLDDEGYSKELDAAGQAAERELEKVKLKWTNESRESEWLCRYSVKFHS